MSKRIKNVLTYICRNRFTKQSLLANTFIRVDKYGFTFNNMLVPYDSTEVEFLEDWEIGQYLGGN